MERITVEQSNKFIPLDEDYTGLSVKDASYFTLEPLSEGWEKVRYFTARFKTKYADKGEGDQWVYVLSNPTLPNLLKIGYTKLNPEVRASQISSATGVPLPYVVEWAFKCFNGEQLEGEVHVALKEYRVNTSREFFQISLEEAKEKITKLGKNYIA